MQIEQSTQIPGRQSNAEYSAGIFRGRIQGVSHADGNTTKQTLVDVFMYDLMPALSAVPIATAKINSVNGEQASPEIGDLVMVGFIGGNRRDPVVLGYLPTANNQIQATADEAPCFKRRQNYTTETIAKDGSRIVHVAKDDTITIKGDGTVIIQEGDLTFDVSTGAASITVKGNVTLNTDGDLTATVGGSADVTAETMSLQASGAVSVTTTGALTAEAASASVTALGVCSVLGASVNVVSTGNVSIAGTGTVSISGANVAITA